MKSLILVLVLLSFLQSTIIPLDLVLIVLILRSFIKTQAVNLILALSFGLLISHLGNTPLGLDSLVYLFLVQISHLIAKSPLSQQIVSIVGLVSMLYAIKVVVTSLLLGQSIQLFPSVVVAGLISLPLYILVRFWEERFMVRDIKLKI